MDFDNLSEVLPESSKATEERRLDDNKLRSGDGPRRIQVAPPAPTPTPTQPPTEIGTPAPSGGTGMGGLLLEPLRYWSPFLAAQTDWNEWKSVACSVYKVATSVKNLPWSGNFSASCIRECNPTVGPSTLLLLSCAHSMERLAKKPEFSLFVSCSAIP